MGKKSYFPGKKTFSLLTEVWIDGGAQLINVQAEAGEWIIRSDADILNQSNCEATQRKKEIIKIRSSYSITFI